MIKTWECVILVTRIIIILFLLLPLNGWCASSRCRIVWVSSAIVANYLLLHTYIVLQKMKIVIFWFVSPIGNKVSLLYCVTKNCRHIFFKCIDSFLSHRLDTNSRGNSHESMAYSHRFRCSKCIRLYTTILVCFSFLYSLVWSCMFPKQEHKKLFQFNGDRARTEPQKTFATS